MGQFDVNALQSMASKNGCTIQKMLEQLQNNEMLRLGNGLTLEQVQQLQADLNSGKAWGAEDVLVLNAKTKFYDGTKTEFKVPLNIDTEIPLGNTKFAQIYSSAYIKGNVVMGVPIEGGEPEVILNYGEPVQALIARGEKIIKEEADAALAAANKGWQSSAENLATVSAAGMAVTGGVAALLSREAVAEAFVNLATKAKFPKEAIAAGVEKIAGLVSELAPQGVFTPQLARVALQKGMIVASGVAFASCSEVEVDNKTEQQVKQKDYTSILNSINNGVNGIRSDIQNLRNDVNSGFDKLSANDKEIISRLDSILLLIQEFKEQEEISNAEMNALISEVNAWLECINAKQDTQIKLQITNGKAFEKFKEELFKILGDDSLDDEAKFNAILKKMGEIKDVDTSILAKLDAMFDDSKIVAAIKELSAQVAGANDMLTLIYNAIMKQGENSNAIKALLEQVLKNQGTQIKDNAAGFKAVIDAISKIPANGTVDLSNLENLMKQLVELNKANGVKLDGIAKQNDVIISILKSLGAKMDGFDAWFNKIYNKIPAGGEGGCKLDFEKLMAKLNEILNAIKDHDVKVTVDVTGEVTCNCGCTDDSGKKHEGVIGNLNDLLG